MNNAVLTLLSASGAAGPGPRPVRRGVVRAEGKAVRDDTGLFHPLGMTFLWALNGWRQERDRYLQNLDWLVTTCARLGIAIPDYLRLLAEVDWPGHEADPAWPDYDQVYLGSTGAMRDRGMRHECTMLGSPYADPPGLARRLSGLLAPTPGLAIDVETWNESSQNGGDVAAMQAAARIFLEQSGVPLVALSSDVYDDDLGPATLITAHTDRGQGEGGWRMVRQGFDAKDARSTYSGNEPPGINSSVNTLESPLQLAMLRAVTVQSGGALWVLHVGDMVMGIEDPAHGRHPNLWEVDGLEAALVAVRTVDAWMPEGVENWQKSAGNPTIAPQALVCDITGWPDGGEGTNRCYCAFADGRFTQTLCGIKGRRTFTQVCPDGGTYHITGINPETGATLDVTLASGQTIVLEGPPDGMLGFILNGTRVGPAGRTPPVYPPLVVSDDVARET